MAMEAAPGQWSPKREGAITDLSPILNPLAPFLDQVTVTRFRARTNHCSQFGVSVSRDTTFIASPFPSRMRNPIACIV
jgi:hypothetical protein